MKKEAAIKPKKKDARISGRLFDQNVYKNYCSARILAKHSLQ